MMILACFGPGCASKKGVNGDLLPSDPVILTDVNDKTKMTYLDDIKNTLKMYHQLLSDLKSYHKSASSRELSKEINDYIETYVANFIMNHDSNSSIDVRMEVAKIHLQVVSLYLAMGDPVKAQSYLTAFSEFYQKDTYLLEKTLNNDDIGYSSLGEGLDILAQRVRQEMTPETNDK